MSCARIFVMAPDMKQIFRKGKGGNSVFISIKGDQLIERHWRCSNNSDNNSTNNISNIDDCFTVIMIQFNMLADGVLFNLEMDYYRVLVMVFVFKLFGIQQWHIPPDTNVLT